MMKQNKLQKKISGIGLIFILALLLVACGGTPTPAQPTNTAQAIQPTATTTSQPSPTLAPATATTAPTVAPSPTPAPATATSQPSPTLASATTAPTVAPSPTSAPPTATTAPTVVANTSAVGFVYYQKEDGLWLMKRDGSEKKQLTSGVTTFVQANANTLVYLQKVTSGTNSWLDLKMLQIKDGVASPEVVLDSKLYSALPASQQSNYPGGLYGVDSRALGNMAVSPDGTTLAYIKANQAVSFNGMTGKENPTELWVVQLDPANPAPKRLVANDKDYIFRPLWSTDGNRINFTRTNGFGTGAGYATALWSVYKDGSRLAFLTGPDLGTVGGIQYRAGPAFNINWVNPLALVFQSFDGDKSTLWLHNLSLNSDYPQFLASDVNYSNNAVFCPAMNRLFYGTIEASSMKAIGLYSIEINALDTQGKAPAPKLVEKGASQMLGCQKDAALYRNAQGQVILQRFNADGTKAGTAVAFGKAVNVEDGKQLPNAELAPGGDFVALQVLEANGNSTIAVFRADGTPVAVANSLVKQLDGLYLKWLDEKLLVVGGFTSQTDQQFYLVDMANSSPTLKPGDSAKAGLNLNTTGRNFR